MSSARLSSVASRLLRKGAFVASICAVAIMAVGQEISNGPVSGELSTKAQEFPQVTVVKVTVPDRNALQRLAMGGYIIDDIRGLEVTVYASAEELAELAKAGYDFKVIRLNPASHPEKSLEAYHTYAELTTALEAFAATHSNICRLTSLGQSVQGRDLWAMLITDNPDVEEDEPEFKYVSTMHGNESVGTEMCLNLIEQLLTNYGLETRVTALVDNTAIWFLPLMNPDGLEVLARTNANGADLNRSFPTIGLDFFETIFDGEPLGAGGREPEVRHVMNWTASNSFVLSANFHNGALVANYPYDLGVLENENGLVLDDLDNLVPISSGVDAPTPDDILFEALSRTYSIHNPPMYNSSRFSDGITNGSAWYSIPNGMQDWNYRYAGCMEITIELHEDKPPDDSLLPGLWQDNEKSMLSYMEAVHIGVRGLVTDTDTGAPLLAKVTVAENKQPVFTDPDIGDYHRLLLPGVYDFTFEAPDYFSQTVSGVLVEEGPATRADVTLARAFHAGDVLEDRIVSISELLRVIQLFNFGEYHCDPTNPEDGYSGGAGPQDCLPHDSDYAPQDWRIDLSEILRFVQFFNAGGYHYCAPLGTEDDFCSGPR